MQYAFWAMWGLLGGAIVEGLELGSAIRRVRGWPWKHPDEVGLGPYLASVAIRLLTGAGLAAALGGQGQIAGPFGALTIGITAPLIIEKLMQEVPGGSGGDSEPAGETSPAQENEPRERGETGGRADPPRENPPRAQVGANDEA